MIASGMRLSQSEKLALKNIYEFSEERGFRVGLVGKYAGRDKSLRKLLKKKLVYFITKNKQRYYFPTHFGKIKITKRNPSFDQEIVTLQRQYDADPYNLEILVRLSASMRRSGAIQSIADLDSKLSDLYDYGYGSRERGIEAEINIKTAEILEEYDLQLRSLHKRIKRSRRSGFELQEWASRVIEEEGILFNSVRAVDRAVGAGWISSLAGLPVFSQIFNKGYDVINRNRKNF